MWHRSQENGTSDSQPAAAGFNADGVACRAKSSKRLSAKLIRAEAQI